MGETAENVARQWNISREDAGPFLPGHHNKNMRRHWLQVNGKKRSFRSGGSHKGCQSVNIDEHPGLSSLEKLSLLKPAFAKDGTVTAGNSSGINDGSAAMLLAEGGSK